LQLPWGSDVEPTAERGPLSARELESETHKWIDGLQQFSGLHKNELLGSSNLTELEQKISATSLEQGFTLTDFTTEWNEFVEGRNNFRRELTKTRKEAETRKTATTEGIEEKIEQDAAAGAEETQSGVRSNPRGLRRRQRSR